MTETRNFCPRRMALREENASAINAILSEAAGRRATRLNYGDLVSVAGEADHALAFAYTLAEAGGTRVEIAARTSNGPRWGVVTSWATIERTQAGSWSLVEVRRDWASEHRTRRVHLPDGPDGRLHVWVNRAW